MAELIFIEGVSGVGKTTMIHALTERLRADGYRVKKYVEFDFTNPIDFYCTAYVPLDEYDRLCAEHASEAESIRRYTIRAGKANLIRYYDDDTPLFSEPLLSKLGDMELCYHPVRLIPIDQYTSAYQAVWQNFAAHIGSAADYYVFDGSLLHHPINDMMRNYQASSEQILSHVCALTDTLAETAWRVFYLKTDDIAQQLIRAHRTRGQQPPSKDEIAFWLKRYDHDMDVLERGIRRYRSVDVSNGAWDFALQEVILSLRQTGDDARG